jgi:16S rRNA (cytidine1402-2'-O)-methyltransferase
MDAEGGTLWIVATPIGTLGDLAPRARQVLERADLIFAEDTRRAAKLLGHVGVAAGRRMRSLHEHNEARRLPAAVEAVQLGRTVVLMSDAGTPVLSDPGFLLVREARRLGLRVATVAGPSSFTAALAASGQPPLPALLVGFLPPRPGARLRRVAELADSPWTMVILLSPHRLDTELEDLCRGLGGDRPATLLAEISKLHERAVSATLGELAESDEARRPRGEYVLVVGPPVARPVSSAVDAESIRRAYATAVARGLSRKEALKTVATELGVGRKTVFDALVDHEKPDGV